MKPVGVIQKGAVRTECPGQHIPVYRLLLGCSQWLPCENVGPVVASSDFPRQWRKSGFFSLQISWFWNISHWLERVSTQRMLNETHLLAELHHRLAVSSLQFRALSCTSVSWLTWTLCLCRVLYSVYNTFPEKTSFGAHNGPGRKAVNYAFSQWTRPEAGYVPAVLLGKGLFGEWSLRDVRQLKHSVNRRSGKSRD